MVKPTRLPRGRIRAAPRAQTRDARGAGAGAREIFQNSRVARPRRAGPREKIARDFFRFFNISSRYSYISNFYFMMFGFLGGIFTCF